MVFGGDEGGPESWRLDLLLRPPGGKGGRTETEGPAGVAMEQASRAGLADVMARATGPFEGTSLRRSKQPLPPSRTQGWPLDTEEAGSTRSKTRC